MAKSKKIQKAKKQRDDSDEDEDFENEDFDEEQDDEPSGKKRRSAFVDDAAEEDDEDEEEDDDGDEDGGGKKGKKRLKRSRFVDDIAAVDEDEDEEEEEEEGVDDLIHDEGEELPEVEDVARRYEREHASFRQQNEEMDAEQLERYVQERFGNDREYGDVADGTVTGAVEQQALLPTHADPKLWIVECRPGEEREAVVKLLQKAINLSRTPMKLLIKAAFIQDHLKGFVYVEAYKEAHVKEAIRGLRNFFPSKGVKLVPLKEMVDAITVNRKAKAAMRAGDWVRIKGTSVYKGDLGKVASMEDGGKRAKVKVVPRLDYADLAKPKAKGERAPFGQFKGPKPPARAFSATVAKDHGLYPEPRRIAGGGVSYVMNSRSFEDGYEVKTFSSSSLTVEAKPPLEEVQAFNQVGLSSRADADTEGGELAQLVRSLGTDEDSEDAGSRFSSGDRVEVIDTDLKGLKGRVTSVLDDGRVDMQPTDPGLEVLTFEAKQLRKHFEDGDRVKVNNGQHVGKTGMIVRVEDPIAVVFTDNTNEQISVFVRDLSETAGAASGLDSFEGYDLHELVVLDQHTVGVIVSVAATSCRILTNKGTPEKPLIQMVASKKDIVRSMRVEGERARATDGMGKSIAAGDMVELTVNGSKLKGQLGTVKYIYRGSLFLKINNLLENGGFACVRSNMARVRGGSKAAPALAGGVKSSLTSMNVLRSPMPYGSMPASPQVNGGAPSSSGRGGGGGFGGSRGGFGGGGGRGYGAYSRDSNMIGKKVTLKSGHFRGYTGWIRQVTEDSVRFELEAQQRTVTVARSCLPPEAGGAPAPRPMPVFGQAGLATPARIGSQTPSRGSWAPQTPLHPGMTPMHPSMTPAHPGSATPMHDNPWNPAAMTPRHPSQDNPSITHPGEWGDYAATPAFTPAFTPGDAPESTAAWQQSSGNVPPAGLDTARYSPYIGTPGTAAYSQAGLADTVPRADLTPAVAETPGLAGTPGYMQTAQTPNPGTPAFQPPATDWGTAPEQGRGWDVFEGVVVELADSGRLGVVQRIAADGACTVAIGNADEDKRVQLPDAPEMVETVGSNLKLVPPKKKDAIRIVGGKEEFKGKTGQLLSFSNEDAITKLEGKEIQVLPQSVVGLLYDQEASGK